jgi:hypothetical protein
MTEDLPTSGKICRRCKEDWPPDNEFYWRTTDTMCRACQYEQRLERTAREQANPELRAKKLAQNKAYKERQKATS